MPNSSPVEAAADRDLSCIRCAYNLRSLNPAGRCPECGLTISRTQNFPFRFQSAQAVRMAFRGIALLAVSMLFGMAMTITFRLSVLWMYELPALFRTVVQTWKYGAALNDALHVSAILLIAWACGAAGSRRSRWGARATSVLALVWFTDRLLEFLSLTPGVMRSYAFRLGVEVYLPVALWLLGLLLLRSVGSDQERTLHRLLMVVQVALTGLLFNWFIGTAISSRFLDWDWRVWYIPLVAQKLHNVLWIIVFCVLLFYQHRLRRALAAAPESAAASTL